MRNEDNKQYYCFTGPQRLDKAIHTLDGIIRGVAIDNAITPEEAQLVQEWVNYYREFASRHPFNEVIPALDDILADGIIDSEEQADLLWLCDKLVNNKAYFDQVTADMQVLQGLLAGVITDGEVTEHELRGIQKWMQSHEHLKTCWPYDELESLIATVMQDGVIDDQEHDALLAFFSEFTLFADHQALSLSENASPGLISGVCALDPIVEFAGRKFTFTGRSERFTRKEFASEIEKRGGTCSKSVTADVDYLTIGSKGSDCWTYSCYGRKVEEAITHRKNGYRILLVHEYDIWDALEDNP